MGYTGLPWLENKPKQIEFWLTELTKLIQLAQANQHFIRLTNYDLTVCVQIAALIPTMTFINAVP